MRKNALLSMALLSAIVATGTAPLSSYAAEAKSVQSIKGNGYQIYIGQGTCSLSQVLKDLCSKFDGSLNFCPEIDVPEQETPDNSMPEFPTPEVPEIPTPDTPTPESPAPEAPAPEAPESPAPEVPEVPETPDTPETDSSQDETALSYAEQVVKLVNEERAKAGLSELTMDTNLTAAANTRAKEIKEVFSHTRPDGSSFSTVLKEHGVTYRGSGENIAWGQKTPKQVMNGWMNSDGHRANILNKNFKNIGIGYYQDENGTNHWVQLFTY